MSDIKTLDIPKWGLSMEEGTIAQWLIQEGTSFNKGDDICEIETTKIINVLEAPFDGVLRKIIAQQGDTLLVGGVIAICAAPEVSDIEVEAYAQSLAGVSTPESNPNSNQVTELVSETVSPAASTNSSTPVQQNATNPVAKPVSAQSGYVIPASLQGYDADSGIYATLHAGKLAEKHNLNLAKFSGSGREGRINIQDIQAAVRAAGGTWPDVRHQASKKVAKSNADDSQVSATPIARRLAKQWDINLHDCRASGSRGRVCKQDVEAVYQRENPLNHPQSEMIAQSEKSQVTSIAMGGMRKAIASRLQAAKRNAPHFRLSIDLNVEAIQALRLQVNSTIPDVKLSINDMLIKAAAAALIEVPQVNVQFDEENQQILQFDQADISVAVAIDNGLITPIVKAANKKSLTQISNDMRDLVTRAKTGKLAADEFQGGTFSISNLGMLGIQQFDAIINPPQGAILALGAAEKRAIVEKDQIVIRQMIQATLSCDHRVIDGALGAEFLAAFKQFVEYPALILV